jgi:hypothetical protein
MKPYDNGNAEWGEVNGVLWEAYRQVALKQTCFSLRLTGP